MKSFVDRILPKSRLGRTVIVLASGTALSQIITAASMPIVTRLYSPEMIGVISVFLSFFNFWLVLLSCRYESALLVTQSEEESHHVFRLSAALVLLNALLAVPILAWLSSSDLLGFGVLPEWSPFVAFICLLGYGWFMAYRSWLLRLQETRIISFSAISRSGANASTRVIMGMFNSGMYGLFLAEVLGSWFALGAVRTKTKALLKTASPPWRIDAVSKVAIKYNRFLRFELPSVLINQLAVALPVPLVGSLYGAEAAGWFGMARLLYAMPNGQIGKAVGDVFQMELGHSVRAGDTNRGRSLFYAFTIRLALVGSIPLVLAVALAPKLVPFIFGKDWAQMGDIVAQMAPWMFMALVVGSMSRALSVLQLQQWKLLYDSFALLTVIVVYIAAERYSLALPLFIEYLSFGLCITYVLYFFIIRMAIERMAR